MKILHDLNEKYLNLKSDSNQKFISDGQTNTTARLTPWIKFEIQKVTELIPAWLDVEFQHVEGEPTAQAVQEITARLGQEIIRIFDTLNDALRHELKVRGLGADTFGQAIPEYKAQSLQDLDTQIKTRMFHRSKTNQPEPIGTFMSIDEAREVFRRQEFQKIDEEYQEAKLKVDNELSDSGVSIGSYADERKNGLVNQYAYSRIQKSVALDAGNIHGQISLEQAAQINSRAIAAIEGIILGIYEQDMKAMRERGLTGGGSEKEINERIKLVRLGFQRYVDVIVKRAVADRVLESNKAVPVQILTNAGPTNNMTQAVVPPSNESSPLDNTFSKENLDLWILSFNGQKCRIPHMDGISYLHHLILNQGKDVDVNELYRICSPAPEVRHKTSLDDGFSQSAGGKDQTLDTPALGSLKKEIEDKEFELAEMKKLGGNSVEKLEFELLELKGRLVKDVNIRGKSRDMGGDGNHRAAVKNSIDRAKNKIKEHMPVLHEHLEAHISTGQLCAYKPAQKMDWSL